MKRKGPQNALMLATDLCCVLARRYAMYMFIEAT